MEKIRRTNYENNKEKYTKYFSCNGISISRGDYESLPCAIFTAHISDDTMQRITDTIYQALTCYFSREEISLYAENGYQYNEVTNRVDELFWEEMETIGLDFGMVYYDDLTIVDVTCGTKILHNDKPIWYMGGATDNGFCYKDETAFNEQEGVIYIGEYELQELDENPSTTINFLWNYHSWYKHIFEEYVGEDASSKMMKYIAKSVWEICDWQELSTYLMEWDNGNDDFLAMIAEECGDEYYGMSNH
jgi:hypothetical protein